MGHAFCMPGWDFTLWTMGLRKIVLHEKNCLGFIWSLRWFTAWSWRFGDIVGQRTHSFTWKMPIYVYLMVTSHYAIESLYSMQTQKDGWSHAYGKPTGVLYGVKPLHHHFANATRKRPRMNISAMGWLHECGRRLGVNLACLGMAVLVEPSWKLKPRFREWIGYSVRCTSSFHIF